MTWDVTGDGKEEGEGKGGERATALKLQFLAPPLPYGRR